MTQLMSQVSDWRHCRKTVCLSIFNSTRLHRHVSGVCLTGWIYLLVVVITFAGSLWTNRYPLSWLAHLENFWVCDPEIWCRAFPRWVREAWPFQGIFDTGLLSVVCLHSFGASSFILHPRTVTSLKSHHAGVWWTKIADRPHEDPSTEWRNPSYLSDSYPVIETQSACPETRMKIEFFWNLFVTSVGMKLL